MGVEIAGVGVGDQREQHRDFGVEPGHRLILVRQVGGQHARLRQASCSGDRNGLNRLDAAIAVCR